MSVLYSPSEIHLAVYGLLYMDPLVFLLYSTGNKSVDIKSKWILVISNIKTEFKTIRQSRAAMEKENLIHSEQVSILKLNADKAGILLWIYTIVGSHTMIVV